MGIIIRLLVELLSCRGQKAGPDAVHLIVHFRVKDGTPYLEVHHRTRLSNVDLIP